MRQMISLFAVCAPVCMDTVWKEWYRFCMRQEQENAFVFSHVSCSTETLNPNGIRTRSRYLKKMEACIDRKEEISAIEFYLLPKDFHQAVFDFKVYMALSLGGGSSYCEITVEDRFWDDFAYPIYFEELRKFLRITKAEVNLLPYEQVFNYHVNCILNTNGVREKYGVIEQIYAE